MNEEDKKQEILKEIVLMNIDSMPSNYKLSLGGKGVFDKNQLIEHINKMDDVGKQILNIESRFLKAVSRGEVTKALTSV